MTLSVSLSLPSSLFGSDSGLVWFGSAFIGWGFEGYDYYVHDAAMTLQPQQHSITDYAP